MQPVSCYDVGRYSPASEFCQYGICIQRIGRGDSPVYDSDLQCQLFFLGNSDHFSSMVYVRGGTNCRPDFSKGNQIFPPLITILVSGVVTLSVLGPIGYVISNYIATFLRAMESYGWLVSMILGAVFRSLL